MEDKHFRAYRALAICSVLKDDFEDTDYFMTCFKKTKDRKELFLVAQEYIKTVGVDVHPINWIFKDDFVWDGYVGDIQTLLDNIYNRDEIPVCQLMREKRHRKLRVD